MPSYVHRAPIARLHALDRRVERFSGSYRSANWTQSSPWWMVAGRDRPLLPPYSSRLDPESYSPQHRLFRSGPCPRLATSVTSRSSLATGLSVNTAPRAPFRFSRPRIGIATDRARSLATAPLIEGCRRRNPPNASARREMKDAALPLRLQGGGDDDQFIAAAYT